MGSGRRVQGWQGVIAAGCFPRSTPKVYDLRWLLAFWGLTQDQREVKVNNRQGKWGETFAPASRSQCLTNQSHKPNTWHILVGRLWANSHISKSYISNARCIPMEKFLMEHHPTLHRCRAFQKTCKPPPSILFITCVTQAVKAPSSVLLCWHRSAERTSQRTKPLDTL